ncbi:uncharacterized protein J7T54_004003 [Emericellopsis cladophorae]|uniref:Ubiquitin-like domain-containing protein n=1 Tax=Emericellopsis cladophorae TaxID=2686198 RepID=A0A9P9Y0U5_9HYPO|nr:uncharacterized protein J7T54_004003 [Emericellopsis cladophorae]KAI6781231.1 hypothetical protein J7T54_004003 [Emericellopsis cladophorae]
MPLTQRPERTIQSAHAQPGGSQSTYSDGREDTFDSQDEEDYYDDDDDEVDPSDSASASNGPTSHLYQPRGPYRSHSQHQRQNQHVVPLWRGGGSPGATHAPYAPPQGDQGSADFGMGEHYPQRPYHQGPRARRQNAYYGNGNGDPHSHAEYASGQRGHGGPVAPYQGMGGMVPFGQQYGNNPFAAHGPNGASFYDSQAPYAMMQYGAPGFYGDPRQYSMPQHMQQYQMAPVPAATEHPGREVTPVPKEDIEKKRMADELAAIKAMQEEAKAAEKRKEDEARIKKEAEEAFKQRMEEARLYNERAAAEVAKARAEAERAARERIEAERKAQEEAAKQRADDMKRAEENARMKFEADQKAAEERRRKEDEDRKRAEEAARIRVEAAIKAEAEARAAAEKKMAEEAERIKKIEEDAKRKAEADAAAKVEQEKADAIAKAEAEAAAKKEQEELKMKWQEEARQKAENSAKQKADKAPIRFKDAVGRKFSFPFHLCQTWAGMEELIKQAFLQVDLLGPHVQEGHYDLTGPNGGYQDLLAEPGGKFLWLMFLDIRTGHALVPALHAALML